MWLPNSLDGQEHLRGGGGGGGEPDSVPLKIKMK